MKKIIILVLLFVIFVVNGGMVWGQLACGPTQLGGLGCLPTISSCGFVQCETKYNSCDGIVSATCLGETATCLAIFNECIASCPECPCEAEYYPCLETAFTKYAGEQAACIGIANVLQTSIIDGGVFGGVGCGEMTECVLKSSLVKDATNVMNCQSELTSEAKARVISDYAGGREEEIINQMDIKKWPELNKNLNFKIPNTVIGQGQFAEGLDGFFTNDFYQAQSNAIRATDIVREAVAIANQGGPFYIAEQSWVNYLVDTLGISPKDLPKFLAGQGLTKLAGLLFGGGDEDEDQNNYRRTNSDAAGNANTVADTYQSNCQASLVYCSPKVTNVPGYKKCENQPLCIQDNCYSSTQCTAALSKDAKIQVASLHVIDKKLNNMFTMTGSENKGVVYQDDGFVNIDQGGTTKLSIAGEGAFITDANSNQLYVGSGTTTYLGNGNEDKDTYLTNAAIYDFKSKVGVEGVNEIEQKRLEKPQAGSQKQAFELAVTFNKQDLKPYKNSIDIGKLREHYQILARGFSNIILLENNKVFPLATRNYAKGDALIVKYKNVRISNAYSINDENYEYTIKAIDDSTKVIAKNGKVIQDSGPFSYKLSKRQSLLVYNI